MPAFLHFAPIKMRPGRPVSKPRPQQRNAIAAGQPRRVYRNVMTRPSPVYRIQNWSVDTSVEVNYFGQSDACQYTSLKGVGPSLETKNRTSKK